MHDDDSEDENEDFNASRQTPKRGRLIQIAQDDRVYEYVDVPQYLDPFPLPSEASFSLRPVVYATADTCCAAVPEFGVHRGVTFSRTLVRFSFSCIYSCLYMLCDTFR